MPVPQEILLLVERYRTQRDSYRTGTYNEAQLRIEFLDPFFKALGWDMDNTQGHAEAYKDVIHEDAIRIGSAIKAPDYCFRIGGNRKFFVEAKKPAIPIRDESAAAYQLRRYAWSAKLPLGILVNFEDFAVYDCRIRPSVTDTAAVARIFHCTFEQYAEQWDWIAERFSREAILKGAFDRFAESSKGKKGTTEVDAAFLAEIEGWRGELARVIALRNEGLSTRELNFAVQRIIDRLVFLRICEDRGIEDYGRLLALTNGTRIYPRLCALFLAADTRYNSGIFRFTKNDGDDGEAPDELTTRLEVDDAVLQNLLRGLYYPDSPYEFSVLSADILGQVYEQFLGKVIRLTDGHRAVVEEKPEVKKAGGVFYTPTFIVESIVRETLDGLLADKTPKQVAVIRILDPACGSGSFLIGAYQRLLDWHRDWYSIHDPEKWARGARPTLVHTTKGEWRLTIEERKRILLNNIHGVDIDSQAVEVTKLSLLLKVLEGETGQSLQLLFDVFHERALPDLGRNIKCGNSLIGPEFYSQLEMDLFDENERLRINVFDWVAEFPTVFAAGGFDAIIGNPPYIRIQAMKEWAPREVEFYRQHYHAASQGNYDIYVVFVEKGLALLNPAGRLGFILPHKFFNATYGAPLRELLSKRRHLSQIVHFGAQQVFAGATTYTCLLFLEKCGRSKCRFCGVPDLAAWIKDDNAAVRGELLAEKIDGVVWNFTVGEDADLVARLKTMPVKLGDLADIFVGLQTSADDVFIMNLVSEGSRTLRLHSKALNADITLEKALLHPLLSGTDVSGYAPLPDRQYILFPYEVDETSVRLIPQDELARRYPKASDYLLANRKRLVARENGKLKRSNWHGYIYLKNMRRQTHIKLCVPRLVDQLCAGFDSEGSHYLDNVDVGGVTLKPEGSRYDLRYLLGLLNSRLLAWFFPHVSAPFRGGWMSANRQFLSQVPIRVIDFDNPADRACHDRMVKLADQMLALHRQRAVARTPQEQTALDRQITATETTMDRLVYELYALKEADIATVEQAKCRFTGS